MINAILRAFGLDRDDLAKLLPFASLAFLLQTGLSIGMSAGDALFVSGAGAANLPYIYMATAGAMLIYTPTMAYVSGRFGADGALALALLVLTVGGALVWAGLTNADMLPPLVVQAFPYLVRLYSAIWFIGLYTLYWNFVDDYFDIQDGKRLFALLSAGTALGGITGGTIVNTLAEHLPVPTLYLLWAALALATLPLLLVIKRRWPQLSERADMDEGETGRGTMSAIGEGLRSSRYIPMVVGVFLLSLLMGNINEFQYLSVFAQGRDETDLAQLFGELYGTASALTLVINLFLFNRLVLRLGVRSVALIVPSIYMLVFTFYFVDFGLVPALLGFMLLQGIVPAIDFNNFNFLFNAIDEKYRKQVRTLVEGLCEPFVTASAGVALLLLRDDLSPEQLSAIAMLLALALILLVLALRSSYRQSMVSNLRRGWLDFGREPSTTHDERDLQSLRRLAADPAAPEDVQISALDMLLQSGQWLATDLKLLLQFIDGASPHGQVEAQRLLRRVLADGAGRQLLLLADDPSRKALWSRAAMVAEFGAHYLLDRGRIDGLHQRLAEPDMAAAAVIALWHSSDPDHCRTALTRLSELRKGDEQERLAAVQALGRLGEERFAHLITDFLTDAAPEVRHGALVALQEMGPLKTMHLTDHILSAIRRASPEARAVGIAVLSSANDPTVLLPLLELADLLTPFERRALEKAATGLGKSAIPTLVRVLRDRRYSFSSRAVAARTLARLSATQFAASTRGLAAAELHHAYAAEQNQQRVPMMEGSPGCLMLRRVYHDQRHDCLELTLLLLTLGGGLPNFELLVASLDSDNPKVRANALEALEQAADHTVFSLIRGLVDANASQERRRRHAGSSPPPAPGDFLRRALESELPLEAAAAAQALRDLEGEQALPALRARLRQGRADLAQQTVLDLLHLESSSLRMTPVAKLAALCGCDLFQSSPLRDLLTIVAASEQCEIDGTSLFEPGERADNLFLILRGGATLTHPDGRKTEHTSPSLIGMEALYSARYESEAFMAEGEVLVIPAQVILAAAQAYPRLATRLFQHRVAA
jgi:HEAT repeat protein